MLRFCCTLAPEHTDTEYSHSFQHLSNTLISINSVQKSPHCTCLMTTGKCCSSSEFAKSEAGEAELPAAIELERTVEQPALRLLCQ